MSTIEQFRKGEIDAEALRKAVENDDVTTDELSEEELSLIAGGRQDDVPSYSVEGVWYGSDADEDVRGSSGDDTIHALGGNDQVLAGSGNDLVDGGSGDDYLRGKAGDDTVLGGAGDDIVCGGSGADVLDGGTGDDFFIVQGGGDDTLIGGQGDDMFIFDESSKGNYVIQDYTRGEDHIVFWLDKGEKDFTIEYDGTDTVINWGEGHTITVQGIELTEDDIFATDDLRGITNGDDFYMDGTAWGGQSAHVKAGDDLVWGSHGDDSFYGEEGDDTLIGSGGDDMLNGGEGDDSLKGGSDDDTLTGGEGSDTFHYRVGDGNDVITDFTSGEDRLKLSGVTPGSWSVDYDEATGNSVVSIGDGTITLQGIELTDADLEIGFVATDDADTFDLSTFRGDGNTLTGFDPSQDRITVNGDYDIQYDETTGNTVISYDGGVLTVQGVEVDSTVIDQSTTGTDGNDFMGTNAGNDSVYGAGGDDYIYTGEGNDTASGGTGNDVVMTGAGDDVVYGGFGAGNDTLVGGEGADTFVFGDDHGDDVITDFEPGKDTLRLLGAEHAGDISVEHDENGNTIVSYGNTTITLQGVTVEATDLLPEASGGDDPMYLAGTSGDDSLEGGRRDDFVGGGAGDDTLDGGKGRDVVLGGEGDDVLTGGKGRDTVDGGVGNDVVYGGAGKNNDVLSGGAGNDTFVFGARSGRDTVTDFNPEEDTLRLLGIETIDQITVETVDGNTVISFGSTTITLENVEMNREAVWALVENGLV